MPVGYERDALFLLPPDVMAVLIDYASGFSMETSSDRVIFFRPGAADFSAAESWNAMADVIGRAAASFARNASRYRDERIPVQSVSPALQATPSARIGRDGRRLGMQDRRTGIWRIVGAVGWAVSLVLLYPVPAIFAFAGFMSIVDGR